MILNRWPEVLAEVGSAIRDRRNGLDETIHKTEIHNPWFTRNSCEMMLSFFAENYFDREKLTNWTKYYDIIEEKNKSIGLVLAGNIPFVGMHDLISTLVSGNRALVKMSSKDQYFFPWLKEIITAVDPKAENKIEFADRLKDFDAVIATGSGNSSRYFKYYFGKYPHIIRKNRTSIAILNGDESENDLHELGKDVFYYFGLGCRNVGKIYFPRGFEVEKLFRIWENYRDVIDNNKYKNNYDYNRAILLLNQTPHLANDFFIMAEDERTFSPLACLYYEFYDSVADLEIKIDSIREDLQCVVASGEGNTPFGRTQFPELSDYADHIDTVEFLKNI